MNKREIIGFLLIATAALCFLGGAAFAAGKQEGAAAQETVVLTWASAGFNTEPKLEFANKLLLMYAEKNPNVKIEFDSMAGQDYQTWLQTQLVGGTAPDIYNCWTSWAKEYVKDGAAIDLVPYLEKENKYNPGGKWIDKISPSLIVQMLDPTNNMIGSVPMAVGVNKIMYNKKYFEETGIKDEPETYAELIEVCKKFKARNIAAFSYPLKGSGAVAGGFLHWVQRIFMDALTDHLMDDLDLNDSYFVDVNEMVGGFDKGIIDLTKSPWKDIYPQIKDFSQYWLPGGVTMDWAAAIERFARGDSAMIHSGIWMVKRNHDNPYRKFDLGVLTWPAITKETHPLADGKHHALGGMPQNNNALNPSLKGARLDAAVDFLMYINSEEVGEEQAKDIWMASPLKDMIPAAGPIGEYGLDYTISRLRLYELDYDKEFLNMANMNGQVYLEGTLSLEDYTQGMQDRLMQVTKNYMQENNWTRENDYGLKK